MTWKQARYWQQRLRTGCKLLVGIRVAAGKIDVYKLDVLWPNGTLEHLNATAECLILANKIELPSKGAR